jgi:thiamine-phosphate pyrophosphorylase
MTLNLQGPIVYLITSGETKPTQAAAPEGFSAVLTLVEAAVAAKVNLVQLREKNLSARALYKLTCQAAAVTRSSETRLLVNDRADIARAAGADGVHLTTRSIETAVVRRTFGADFLIGVSTHSFEEAAKARESGADFAVFGPVFDTVSKRLYGEPLGLKSLKQAAAGVRPFPLVALGGVTVQNASACFRAGASGIAAIRLLSDPQKLTDIVDQLRAAVLKQ